MLFGIFHAQSRGELPHDDREAARLFKLAADQGEAVAQFSLGQFYAAGLGGLPQDEREAAVFTNSPPIRDSQRRKPLFPTLNRRHALLRLQANNRLGLL